jgi:subtilisin family serine protease
MCKAVSVVVVAFLVSLGPPGWPQEGRTPGRFKVRGEESPKLAPELEALKRAGGRLIGRTKSGEAVIEGVAAPGIAAQLAAPDEVIESIRELIVGYQPGQRPPEAALRAAGLQVVEENVEGSYLVVVPIADALSAESVAILAANEAIRFAEPNYQVSVAPPVGADKEGKEGQIKEGSDPEDGDNGYHGQLTPNDPDFAKLWGLANCRAPLAWDTVTNSPAIVAVIDTGVDYKHEDLAANMWKNPGEVPGDGKDNDGNGIVDDYYGADFINNDGDPLDDNRHGTHCAGTIAAVGYNAKGVVGVVWGAKIMALKFLSAGGGGNVNDAIKCVDYAIKKGARVLSNSWGGGGKSQAMIDAITRAEKAGVLFVAAAGNHGGDNDAAPFYPATYDNPNIIAVLSIDKDDKKSSFSAYGKKTVDIGAPGRDILSCLPGNQYGLLSGTSMATPHVAGGAVLLWGHMNYSNVPWQHVRDAILGNARPLPDLAAKCVAGGTLDLAFLGSAFTTHLTREAYNHFASATLKDNVTALSVTFQLKTTMFVHITAQTTAKMTAGTPGAVVMTGLYTAPTPSVIYTHSLRRSQFDALNDVQPVTTSFGMRLGPGYHTVYWNVWCGGATLGADSGTLMVEAFGSKAGGILEVQDAPDTITFTDEGLSQQLTLLRTE